MTRIAIIGGGVSGLAAAFTLEEHRRAGTVEYTVYEASSRLGGVLRTEHIQGCLVEAGPASFITEKPWAADLCRAIGLGDQLIGSTTPIARPIFSSVDTSFPCPRQVLNP